MKTYSHGGDLGDIIYALPAIKTLGGGTIRLVHDCTWNIREPMTYTKYINLKPILEAQPYIHGVEYDTKNSTTPLDAWRGDKTIYQQFRDGTTICDLTSDSVYAPRHPHNEPWLTCPTPTTISPTIIHRSARYHNPNFNWPLIATKYAHTAILIGYKHEHDTWVQEYGPIPFYPTHSLWELFCIIAGATTFIGNQSFPMSLAIGLDVPTIIQERSPIEPNCSFNRSNLTYEIS